MLYIIEYFVVVLLFCLLLVIINFFLGYIYLLDRDKSRSFECGFTIFGGSRLFFSIRYFLLTVIFVVFDVEVVLLFPGVAIIMAGVSGLVFLVFEYFLIILFFGVLYEIKEGAIRWTY